MRSRLRKRLVYQRLSVCADIRDDFCHDGQSAASVTASSAVNRSTIEFPCSIHGGARHRDLGGNYFEERNRQKVERRLVDRLEGLAYTVSLHLAT